MVQILLVHWKPAEAVADIHSLKELGHKVQVHSNHGGIRLADLNNGLPDVAVINLDRLPSHGRTTAHWLRSTAATREIPIVFYGGIPAKVDVARQLLSDAVFCSSLQLSDAIQTALTVPQTSAPTAPCSTKPLWQKLEIKQGHRILQLNGPKNLREIFGENLPVNVRLRRFIRPQAASETENHYNTVLLFAPHLQYLEEAFSIAVQNTCDGCPLWVFWPKKTSALASDLTQSKLLSWVRKMGWNDLKICRVDDDWAGQLFRKKAFKS